MVVLFIYQYADEVVPEPSEKHDCVPSDKVLFFPMRPWCFYLGAGFKLWMEAHKSFFGTYPGLSDSCINIMFAG